MVSEAYHRCDLFGLLLGILTGLFLADRFAPVLTVTSLLGGIYMNALNMMIFPLVSRILLISVAAISDVAISKDTPSPR